MILDISIGSIFAAVIPHQLRSRVTGAFQAVNYGTRPAGSLVAGALGTIIGIRPHPVECGHRRPYRIPVAAAFTIARFPVAARKYP